ncbi:MAG: hypothetical protein ACRDDY_08495 [Clostridium sp.]|uniref:hypothetical protein n=1 Tax=Clostridium sp. TaxID=1506 RepID=UPI003EE6568A
MENKTKDEKELEELAVGKKVFKWLGIIILILIIVFIGVKVYKYYKLPPLQREFPGVISMTEETSPAAEIKGVSTDKYILVLYKHITPKEIFNIAKKIGDKNTLEPVVFKENKNSKKGYVFATVPNYKDTIVQYGEFDNTGIELSNNVDYTIQMLTNGNVKKVGYNQSWKDTMSYKEVQDSSNN